MERSRYISIVFGLGIFAIVAVAAWGSFDYVRSRTAEPPTANAYDDIPPEYLGRLLAQKEEHEKTIAADPSRAGTMAQLAIVEKILGNEEHAIELLQRAITVSPKNDYFYRTLADLYRGRQENDAANEAFARAIEFGPTDEENYLQYVDFLRYRFPDREAVILDVYAQGFAKAKTTNDLRRQFAVYQEEVRADRAAALEAWRIVARESQGDTSVREEIARLEALQQ